MITISLELKDVIIHEALERVEKELYKFAMENSQYNQSKAAKLLNVSRGTLRTKLDQYFPGVFLTHKED
jgi:Fis family transcriptional regulator